MNFVTHERIYFILACHGWSASNWTAHALNLHPDVTCTHSARNFLANDKGMHGNDELKDNVLAWNKAYMRRVEEPIDRIYDEIVSLADTKVYGSVHTYRVRDIPIQFQRFGKPSRPYNVANLVRHPVNFLWSGYGQLVDMFQFDLLVLHGTTSLVLGTIREYAFDLAKRHDLNLCDHNVLAFLGAAANFTNLAKDQGVIPGLRHFKMEDITTDRQAYRELLAGLTSNRIDIPERYLNEVFDVGTVNEHKKGTAMTPADRWDSFLDWQREVSLHMISASGIQPHYEEIGYDFSFMKSF